MTLRLLSGNLTVSLMTKKLKDTWTLKLKNNLTKDGVPFNLTSINGFKLAIGENGHNVIDSYYCEDDFVYAELNLGLIKSNIRDNDTIPIYAVLELGEHKEIVEVLAWNGTVISHAVSQNNNNRLGIGRNNNNLFVAWKYHSSIQINSATIHEDVLFLEIKNNNRDNYVMVDNNGNKYTIDYIEELDRYTLNLNLIDYTKNNEFIVKSVISNTSITISNNLLNTELAWNKKGIQFDYDNLGNCRIRILKKYIFVSKIEQQSDRISLELKLPLSYSESNDLRENDYSFELILQEKNTPVYVKSIENFSIDKDMFFMSTIIDFNEKIPYGKHDILIQILDSKQTILKTDPVYLGMNRSYFYNNSEKQYFSIVERPTSKNSPIMLQRYDNLLDEKEIVKYSANILNSRLKRQTMEYVSYRENLSVIKNAILYESFFGALSDNPLALFKKIYEKDVEKEFTHIWVVSDLNLTHVLDGYSSENIIFVKYNSSEYFRWLAIAEYIVFNTSTAFPFAVREGQKVLQTWHGVPLKSLGYDMEQARGLNRNVIRSMAQATMYINPNSYTEDKVLNTLDFKDIQKGKRMVVSYPRQQRILKAKDEGYKSYLSQVMPINDKKKIALYAPTWRGANGNYKNVVNEYTEAIDLFNKYLPDDYQLIFKPHKNAAKFFKDNTSTIIVPDWLDVNELLSITDLLISDYSSIIFDYYFTGKPVINWMYDKDEYAKNNGFYQKIFTELVWPTNNEKKLEWMLNHLEKYPAPTNSFIEVAENDINEITDAWLNDVVSDKVKTPIGQDVSLYIIYASEVRRDKRAVIHKIKQLNNLGTSNVMALLHVGDYQKVDDDFFKEIPKQVRNFYRAGQPDVMNSEYIAIKKSEYGKELTVSDHQAIQNLAKRELIREVGNMNVTDVKPLGIIKDDDWASKALVKFKQGH